MGVSLPSREIYSLDVPEIERFDAEFRYNFFTPDESVTDNGALPAKLLKRNSSELDAAFIQQAVTISPRFVILNWKIPSIAEKGKQVSDTQTRNNVFTTNVQYGSLIADNFEKVVTENQFSLNDYVGVCFHDSEIDDKIYDQVSGSYQMNTLSDVNDGNVSHYKAAQRLSTITSKTIKPHFLYKALSNPKNSSNLRFFGDDGKRIFNEYFRRLKDVAINVQVNGKFFWDIANRAIRDPNSQFTSDMHGLQKFSKKLRDNAVQRAAFRAQLKESDFKTFLPPVDINYNDPTGQNSRQPEIVGYIIDKLEVRDNGQAIASTPIIVDNPTASSVIDYQVKYGSTYVYSIRAVAWFTLLAIDDESTDPAIISVLISSKQSNKLYVQTIETTAPPPPVDVNFTWDYERVNPTTCQHDMITGKPILSTGKPGSLLIHWSFPPNAQRDIKKFQVFRRRSIHHPFELLKVYDFDDSLKKYPEGERPSPNVIERLTTPCTFYFDDDFHVGDHNFHNGYENVDPEHDRHPYSSTYIYAIAAIDAHGYTSNYSAQFMVWFDPFKNKLQKKLISHSGAPKPYPNLYLEADTFVDTIRTSGPQSKRMRLIFNPEFYYVTDDQQKVVQVLSTKQTGGSYKLQFINVDNQKSAIATITIDDRTTDIKDPVKPSVKVASKKARRGGRK